MDKRWRVARAKDIAISDYGVDLLAFRLLLWRFLRAFRLHLGKVSELHAERGLAVRLVFEHLDVLGSRRSLSLELPEDGVGGEVPYGSNLLQHGHERSSSKRENEERESFDGTEKWSWES